MLAHAERAGWNVGYATVGGMRAIDTTEWDKRGSERSGTEIVGGLGQRGLFDRGIVRVGRIVRSKMNIVGTAVQRVSLVLSEQRLRAWVKVVAIDVLRKMGCTKEEIVGLRSIGRGSVRVMFGGGLGHGELLWRKEVGWFSVSLSLEGV